MKTHITLVAAAALLALVQAPLTAAAATSDARTLSDNLFSGGVWPKDEVAKGFESLGTPLNKL